MRVTAVSKETKRRWGWGEPEWTKPDECCGGHRGWGAGELCDSSRGGVNKCLFTPDMAPKTKQGILPEFSEFTGDHTKLFTKVEMLSPVALSSNPRTQEAGVGLPEEQNNI